MAKVWIRYKTGKVRQVPESHARALVLAKVAQIAEEPSAEEPPAPLEPPAPSTKPAVNEPAESAETADAPETAAQPDADDQSAVATEDVEDPQSDPVQESKPRRRYRRRDVTAEE